MRRRWDALDIAALIDGAMEAFATEFYGKSFTDLTDKQSKRILAAIREQVTALEEAAG